MGSVVQNRVDDGAGNSQSSGIVSDNCEDGLNHEEGIRKMGLRTMGIPKRMGSLIMKMPGATPIWRFPVLLELGEEQARDQRQGGAGTAHEYVGVPGAADPYSQFIGAGADGGDSLLKY